jgi:MtN3 and saliva related transmembrane protein
MQNKLLKYYEKYMFLIGILGQTLFYAQAFKIFTTGSAEDLSLCGFSLGLISVTSWLIYGLFLKNRVLIIANIFAVCGALFVVTGIFLYG